ncbi:MAG TPA: 16S rRNA (guanine(966)-N(2))-methyltransferase RsmD [Chlamydiales bacterium]|jgi:16S rRNA (guanine(966)-N(2))-methyltransferase RsmD|nr:16S rRNA (guanine(966)-N(2))-methyltransferase RsmD [Chlamydiales bacterium]
MSLRIVGGLFRGRILKSPKGAQTRPTTSLLREAVFNIAASWVENARFLDLFAGSGAMGLEAISRGAAFATFIEKDKRTAACIRENAALLAVEAKVQILALDAKRALSQLLSPYDLIYIDPPYEKEIPELLELIVEKNLLAPRGLLFLEERFQSKTPSFSALELVNSRRYGIAALHQFRHPA